MKTLLASLLTAYCLTSEKVYSKAHFAYNVECGGLLSSKNELEYYKLPSETELTPAEFQAMKKILVEAISRYNQKVGFALDFQISPLIEYGVQYKVALTKEGEKEVWINGFCKDSNRKHDIVTLTTLPISALDGGSCYFNTSINLKKRKAQRIVIHGFA